MKLFFTRLWRKLVGRCPHCGATKLCETFGMKWCDECSREDKE